MTPFKFLLNFGLRRKKRNFQKFRQKNRNKIRASWTLYIEIYNNAVYLKI